MLSKELTNTLFTDIAFEERKGSRSPEFKNTMFQSEKLSFNIIFFRDQPKRLGKN